MATNEEILERLDKLEQTVVCSNNNAEKVAEQIQMFFDNWNGFVKTIKFFGGLIIYGGILIVIFEGKLLNLFGG